MFIDLTHNKIISETLSEDFERSVRESLLPMLEARFGAALVGVQMYEDHLADGFLAGGEWYYPLTLVFREYQELLWIKWKMTRGAFANSNPYAFVGEGTVGFEIADAVPEEFEIKMRGRAIYSDGSSITLKIDSAAADLAFLSGKYSQSFIDEMARQLTREICASQAIESLDGSTLELRLVFAPETYMEHTSENVTYRRLLLTDKGCSPRDFWVKWTRLDSPVAYSVSDTPAEGSVTFELGEDVPQKVREREYRYLIRVDADKYDFAMTRKNVTEWRELLKRAIRRGDVVKIETDDSPIAGDDEIQRELAAILGEDAVTAPVTEPDTSELDDELLRLAKAAVRLDEESDEPINEPTDEPTVLVESVEDNDAVTVPVLVADDSDEPAVPETVAAAIDEEISKIETEDAALTAEEERASTEERIRAEIEAKLRLEYESRARLAAEQEAERLRREQELLRAENERLLEKARREEAERQSEQARLKAEIEAKMRAEARERERLAEAALLAVEEKRRLEAEREEAERARRAEEARLAAERKRAEEEAAKLAAERAKEEERVRREAEQAAEVAKALEEQGAPKYVSRTAEFTFRRIVDPNVTKRIYEIVKSTIEFYHKEDVYIRIKATVPDSSTVKLEFLEVPEEEGELVVNIIKALGKSDLGIAKATLD